KRVAIHGEVGQFRHGALWLNEGGLNLGRAPQAPLRAPAVTSSPACRTGAGRYALVQREALLSRRFHSVPARGGRARRKLGGEPDLLVTAVAIGLVAGGSAAAKERRLRVGGAP